MISLAAIYPVPAYTAPVNTVPPEYDVNNTTVSPVVPSPNIFLNFHFLWFSYILFSMQIFVGNLDLNVSEEELKQNFLQFGEIVSVKVHAGKACGFVQFGARSFFPS
jgi:hypothetical protein